MISPSASTILESFLRYCYIYIANCVVPKCFRFQSSALVTVHGPQLNASQSDCGTFPLVVLTDHEVAKTAQLSPPGWRTSAFLAAHTRTSKSEIPAQQHRHSLSMSKFLACDLQICQYAPKFRTVPKVQIRDRCDGIELETEIKHLYDMYSRYAPYW
jgi:hypothetical protein